MIINQDKLKGCTKNIELVPNFVQMLFPKNNIIINSGFRSAEKNASLPNASKTSAHLTGRAIDLTVEGINIVIVAGKILENINKLPFIKAMFIDVFKGYLHLDEKDRGVSDVIIIPYGRNGELI